MARGNVHLAFAVEGNRGGVHQVAEKRLHVVVGVDLEDRYRNFLPARSGESHIDVAFAVERGIGDGMKVVGNRDRNRDVVGLLTCPLAPSSLVLTMTGPEVAPSGTRATRKSSELINDRAFDVAKVHAGAAQLGRAQALSDDANLASGQSETGCDRLNVRFAVDVLFSQQAVGDAHRFVRGASATWLEVQSATTDA